jgi:FHA domain
MGTHAFVPSLVITEPDGMRGQTFELADNELSVGRSADNGLRIDDPFVSRHHAVIRRMDGALMIEDAHSTSGVVVNGAQISGRTALHAGDQIRLGSIVLEMKDASSPGDRTFVHSPAAQATAARPQTPSPAPPPQSKPERRFDAGRLEERLFDVGASHEQRFDMDTSQQRRFDVDGQQAGVISNVAGNQYNATALRIAPMRRRARRLMRAGLLIMLVGTVVFIIGAVRFGSAIAHCSQADCSNISFGGWAVAGIGLLISMIGAIVVIVSLFMKREARREAERL